MVDYRPQIPVRSAPQVQAPPRVNPAAFGGAGQGIQDFARIAGTEIQFRQEQAEAMQLAQTRANAQVRVASFLQDLEQNPDFRAYPQAWAQQQEQLRTELQGSVSPTVWAAFEPEWTRITGNGTISVRDMAYAREQDHLVAGLTSSQNALLGQAGTPGADHDLNIQMIQENYLEAYRSGLISETDAVRFIERDTQAYRYNQEYAAIGRDPVGWLAGQGASPGNAPVEQGARDYLIGSGVDGVDNSGNAVPDEMRPVFDETLDRLNAAGRAFGEPIQVTNIYRSPEHNEAIGGSEHSQHMEGTAADIPGFMDMSNDRQIALVQALVDAGFTSFGFYPNDRSLHVDRRSTPAMWGGDRTSASIGDAPPGVVEAIEERRANPQVLDQAGPRPIAGAPEGTAGTYRFGTYDQIPGLTPQQNEALYNRAVREANRQLAAAQVEIGNQTEDYLTALSLGMDATPPSDAAIMGAYMTTPDRGAEIIEGIRQAESLTDTFEAMHGMTNDEVRGFIEAEREALTQGPQEGITERSQRVDALSQAADNILAAREDPAAYVMARDADLREMFDEAQSPEDLRTAIETSLAAQTFVDAQDRRPLTEAFATQILENYQQAESPQDRLSYLTGITTALNDDEAAGLVLTQLEEAGLHPGVRFILDANLTAPQAADYLSILEGWPEVEQRFEDLQPSETERNAAYQTAFDVYQDGRGEVWDDRNATIGIDRDALALAGNERETFRRLAIGLAIREGVPDESAVDTASGVVLGTLFAHQVRTPDDLGAAVIPREGSDEVIAGMEAVRIALPGIIPTGTLIEYAGLPVDEDQAASAYGAMRDRAMWVNVGDRYTLVFPGRGFGGRALPGRTWSAEELAEIGRYVADIPDMTERSIDMIGTFVRGQYQ